MESFNEAKNYFMKNKQSFYVHCILIYDCKVLKIVEIDRAVELVITQSINFCDTWPFNS